jgi:hypothetical protein
MNGDTRKHIVASATATCIAEFATLPLCTLKANYQNTNSTSISETSSRIWNRHGIKGFYKASGWAITSQTLSTATKYTLYQSLKDYTSNNFVAGAMSGALSSLITHPVDVVKIHYQMHTPFRPELNKYGPMLFYRGYSKTLSKSIIGSLCFFPLYDMFNTYFNNPLIASMGSAVVSTTIMHPLDYMKTRHIYGKPYFTGWNPRTYFKGISLNLARVVPHFMITMSLIEYFKQKL